LIRAYLHYLLQARNEHSIHSPFVFELYRQTIRRDNPDEPLFRPIRALRKTLLASREQLEITDFGAGSRINASRRRTVRDIVKNSEKPARFGRLLYRLIQQEAENVDGPLTIFDLGTSLGLTTLYEAAAAPTGRVVTFEGCPQTAAAARQNFAQLGYSNIELVVGNLDETLKAKAASVEGIDFAFFDANHRYEPTVRYFETCLPRVHNDTCFVFDDIHWSDEMEKAWNTIKAHPAVTVSIDLFYVGLLFFRYQQPKQDFILRF